MHTADEQRVLDFMTRYALLSGTIALLEQHQLCPVCDNDVDAPGGSCLTAERCRMCARCRMFMIETSAIVADKRSVAPRDWCYGYHDLLARNPLARDPKDPNHKQYHYQPYRRRYHFNERIKMRNNTEPRIPLEQLLLIRHLLLAQLPARYTPDMLNRDSIQIACSALPALYKYAERWLQIRYFIVTGCREHDARVEYDVPQLPEPLVLAMHRLFCLIESQFDRILYLSSSNGRRTVKDNQYGKQPESNALARHNLMQYNYVFHQLTLLCAGEREYRRLRTEFCFPLHKSNAALKKLNAMMTLICEALGYESYALPLSSQCTT